MKPGEREENGQGSEAKAAPNHGTSPGPGRGPSQSLSHKKEFVTSTDQGLFSLPFLDGTFVISTSPLCVGVR